MCPLLRHNYQFIPIFFQLRLLSSLSYLFFPFGTGYHCVVLTGLELPSFIDQADTELQRSACLYFPSAGPHSSIMKSNFTVCSLNRYIYLTVKLICITLFHDERNFFLVRFLTPLINYSASVRIPASNRRLRINKEFSSIQLLFCNSDFDKMSQCEPLPDEQTINSLVQVIPPPPFHLPGYGP